MVNQATKDKSWRVRYLAAENMTRVAKSLGDRIADIAEGYLELCSDTEAEVRSAASECMATIAGSMDSEWFKDHMASKVRGLTADVNPHVRAVVAQNLGDLASSVSKDVMVTKVLPLILNVLKDEVPEVRLELVKKVDILSKVLDRETLTQKLVPALWEIAEDKQWRVRVQAIRFLPSLAKSLGQEYSSKIKSITNSWIKDCVYSVRHQTMDILLELVDI